MSPLKPLLLLLVYLLVVLVLPLYTASTFMDHRGLSV